ncbi:hypothetical protein [Shewanella woodyi]|uniref:Uncharacterized protein n=1 Tax=Shewanella woodyi (strain ATCC 51908 / MS32) TaxID=392500 RepID=B1KF89_SHEWM|nr:hypothetical protein [Shewanella woodyi]ACA86630.1 conserved hypothetical protein [Shewanella woodyi ATCC 51908]
MKKSIYLSALLPIMLSITPESLANSCDINIQQGGTPITANQYNTWKNRILNSSNADLRQAYIDNQCTIRQGPHGGGFMPANANNPHITVRIWDGDICHVFTKVGQQPTFPTTCMQ